MSAKDAADGEPLPPCESPEPFAEVTSIAEVPSLQPKVPEANRPESAGRPKRQSRPQSAGRPASGQSGSSAGKREEPSWRGSPVESEEATPRQSKVVNKSGTDVLAESEGCVTPTRHSQLTLSDASLQQKIEAAVTQQVQQTLNDAVLPHRLEEAISQQISGNWFGELVQRHTAHSFSQQLSGNWLEDLIDRHLARGGEQRLDSLLNAHMDRVLDRYSVANSATNELVNAARKAQSDDQFNLFRQNLEQSLSEKLDHKLSVLVNALEQSALDLEKRLDQQFQDRLPPANRATTVITTEKLEEWWSSVAGDLEKRLREQFMQAQLVPTSAPADSTVALAETSMSSVDISSQPVVHIMSERLDEAEKKLSSIATTVITVEKLEEWWSSVAGDLEKRLREQFMQAQLVPRSASAASTAAPAETPVPSVDISSQLVVVKMMSDRLDEAEKKLLLAEQKLQPLMSLHETVAANESSLKMLRPLQESVEKTLSLLEPIEMKMNDADAAAAQFYKSVEVLVDQKHESLERQLQDLHVTAKKESHDGGPAMDESPVERQIMEKMKEFETTLMLPLQKELHLLEKAVKPLVAKNHEDLKLAAQKALEASLSQEFSEEEKNQTVLPGIDESFVERQIMEKMKEFEMTLMLPLQKELHLLEKAVKPLVAKSHEEKSQTAHPGIDESFVERHIAEKMKEFETTLMVPIQKEMHLLEKSVKPLVGKDHELQSLSHIVEELTANSAEFVIESDKRANSLQEELRELSRVVKELSASSATGKRASEESQNDASARPTIDASFVERQIAEKMKDFEATLMLPLQKELHLLEKIVKPLAAKNHEESNRNQSMDAAGVQAIVEERLKARDIMLETIVERTMNAAIEDHTAPLRQEFEAVVASASDLPKKRDIEDLLSKIGSTEKSQLQLDTTSLVEQRLQPLLERLEAAEKNVEVAAGGASMALQMHEENAKAKAGQPSADSLAEERLLGRIKEAEAAVDVVRKEVQPIRDRIDVVEKRVGQAQEEKPQQAGQRDITSLLEQQLQPLVERIEKAEAGVQPIHDRIAAVENRAAQHQEERAQQTKIEQPTGNSLVEQQLQPFLERIEKTEDHHKQLSLQMQASSTDHHEQISALKANHQEFERQLATRASDANYLKSLLENLERRLQDTMLHEKGKADSVDGRTDIVDTAKASAEKPFVTSQEVQRGTPQEKAAWNAPAYYSLPPADIGRPLMHSYLERDLVEKVLDNEPVRQPHGIPDIVLRDMANSVVREIVGIFESLLDRLLLEKKQDTIRSMVAELMTEDLSATIATGHEQLKKKEIGHIIKEQERLRADLRDSENHWQDRFSVTKELRDVQDDLWTALEEYKRVSEARFSSVEERGAMKSEVNEQLRTVAKCLDEAVNRVAKCEGLVAERAEQLSDVRSHVETTYATKTELHSISTKLSEEASKLDTSQKRSIEELRELAVPRKDLDDLRVLHDTSHKVLSSDTFQVKADVESVTTQLKKFMRSADEMFVTKLGHEQDLQGLKDVQQQLQGNLDKEIGNLTALSATKRALEECHNALQTRLIENEAAHTKTEGQLSLTTSDVKALEGQSKEYATRDFVWEEATKIANQVAAQCDEREETAQLRREFEVEKERLRQTVRQQQHTRNDMNDTIDEVHDLLARSRELHRSTEVLKEHVERVDSRCAKDNQWVQQAVAGQNKAHEELETFYRSFREEFMSHVEWQRSEGERLKNHSTQRYLEQIDKALNLQTKIDKIMVDQERGEMNDSGRNIRLPKVP